MTLKQYYQKNWMTSLIFFLLIFISSSLFPFLDETVLEPTIPWHIGAFSGIGFILSLPIIVLYRLIFGAVSSYSFQDLGFLIPFVTAAIYTWLLNYILFKRKKE